MTYPTKVIHAFRDVMAKDLKPGDFAAGYGEIEWVEFVNGWVEIDVYSRVSTIHALPSVKILVVNW